MAIQTIEEKIMSFLRKQKDHRATSKEISEGLKIYHQKIIKRMAYLRRNGKIDIDGFRGSACVYHIKDDK